MQEQKPTHQHNGPIIDHYEFKLTPKDEVDGLIGALWVRDLPLTMKKWFLTQLERWELIDSPVDFSDESYFSLLSKASEKLSSGEVQLPELDESDEYHEAEYSDAEKKLVPLFTYLEAALGERLKCKLYFESSDYVYVIIREDGRKQVLRTTILKRSLEEAVADIKKVGDLFPPIEIVRLENGQIAILIGWVEGRIPQNADERKQCLQAAEPLNKLKRVNDDADWTSQLDLNDSNFRITNDGRVFVIDQHPILETINNGFKS